MMFDAVAAAIDWLDAYRAGDIETIMKMYANEATIQCSYGGEKSISGKGGLRAYWEQRLGDCPASDLDDVQPSEHGATISFLTGDGVVGATLEFDAEGRITFATLRPIRNSVVLDQVQGGA